MGSLRLLSVAALVASVGTVAVPAAEPTAAELAQSLQKRIDTIHDFSSDFVHVYEGGVLKKQVTERGHLLVKKPGKMRWEYSAPEPKTYVPADKQVVVSPVPSEDEASTASLFLAGKGSLARDFTPSIAEQPPGFPP